MSVLNQPIVCVDVETDGANYQRGHVIEIAVIRIENGEIVDQLSTLINPGVSVPYFITNLTGIRTQDLAGQPGFDDVAERILELCEGAIFVAHNVRFDYSFIKQEFARLGINFTPKMLCSVRLSRALHPGTKGHKLSDLITRHNFHFTARHRAYDDALVVWQFLTYAQQSFSVEVLSEAISRQLRLPSLPSTISQEVIDSLPQTFGIYVFNDESGTPVYIGKSINIRRRVLSHFTRDTAEYKEFKIAQQVHSIEFTQTDGELSALLLESRLIKERMPIYNRKLRRMRQFIVAYARLNEDGYLTLEYRQLSDIQPAEYSSILGVYQTRTKAKAAVLTALRTFDLCPKLCGLEKTSGSCFSYQLKKCRGACIAEEPNERYNARIIDAFDRTSIDEWPYDTSITVSELPGYETGIIVDQWRITGQFVTNGDGELEVSPYEALFDIDAYKILRAFLLQPTSQPMIRPFYSQT